MTTNSTFIYLIAGIVLLHFLIGIGWLLYRIMYAKPLSKEKLKDKSVNNIDK